MTVDDLAALNAMTGQDVTVTEPGDLIEDVDGRPLAVAPSTESSALMLGATIHANDLPEMMTVTEARNLFPNLRIVDTTIEGEQNDCD